MEDRQYNLSYRIPTPLLEVPYCLWIAGKIPQKQNCKSLERLGFEFANDLLFLQVHHHMSIDELRKIFQVEHHHDGKFSGLNFYSRVSSQLFLLFQYPIMKSFKFIQYAIKDQPQLWRTFIGSIWPRMGVSYGWSWNRTIISCLVNETSISGMQTHFPPMSAIVLQIMWVSRLRDFKLIFALICWPA